METFITLLWAAIVCFTVYRIEKEKWKGEK